MKRNIEELLQKEYWIIDILPMQVPRDSAGQYFTVIKYFLEKKRINEIKQKHINVILKLNCYKDICIDEDGETNPDPKVLDKQLKSKYHYIFVEEAMILSEPDDTHMTIFNPDPELLKLIIEICKSEGLYVWKPPIEKEVYL